MKIAGVVVVGFFLGVAESDLRIEKTKECGQLNCGTAEFCSHIDGTCKPCSKICDEGHNQEILLCNQHCQDYIHDRRYVKRGETFEACSERERIEKLQVVATISLIVSLVLLACVLFLILTLWLNNKTKFNIFKLVSQMKKRKKEPGTTGGLKDVDQVGFGPEISTIRIRDDRQNKSNPQVDLSTLTTTFKNRHAKSEPDAESSDTCTNRSGKAARPPGVRLPSEDSTLDFMYDNPALAPSPTMDKEPVRQRNGKGNELTGSDH